MKVTTGLVLVALGLPYQAMAQPSALRSDPPRVLEQGAIKTTGVDGKFQIEGGAPAIAAGKSGGANAVSAPRLPILFIVGDSSAANFEDWGVGWGNLLPTYFDPSRIHVENAAEPGASSRTYLGQGHWDKVLKQLSPGDFVVIQFSENEAQSADSPGTSGTLPGTGETIAELAGPDGRMELVHTYGWYLQTYIRDAVAKGAHPILMTGCVRNLWSEPVNLNHTGRYIDVPALDSGSCYETLRLVATKQHVPVIDLNRLSYMTFAILGKEEIGKMFTKDEGHTNRYGADLNAYLMISAMKGLGDSPLLAFLSPKGRIVISSAASVDYEAKEVIGRSAWTVFVTESIYKYSTRPIEPRDARLPCLWVVGDRAAGSGRGIGAGGQWGWGDLLTEYLQGKSIGLVVQGGGEASTRNFINHNAWGRIAERILPGDFVLIQFGHLDSDDATDGKTGRGTLPGISGDVIEVPATIEGTEMRKLWDKRNFKNGRESVHTYGAYLKMYIADVRKNRGLPILLSPTPRNVWKDGKIVRDQ